MNIRPIMSQQQNPGFKARLVYLDTNLAKKVFARLVETPPEGFLCKFGMVEGKGRVGVFQGDPAIEAQMSHFFDRELDVASSIIPDQRFIAQA